MKNNILEILQQHKLGHIPEEQALNELCILFSVVGQREQLVCPHCKGKGEYIDTHPERYRLKTCECQRAK